MNLFELKEEIDDTNADVEYYEKEVKRLERKTDLKAIDYSKERVDGGIRHTIEEAILELAKASTSLDNSKKKLDNLIELRNKKYNIYKVANDLDKQIYIEKKLLKWKNAKISSKHNSISKSQIYRIVDDLEAKMKQ